MRVPSWKLFQNWVSASDDQGEDNETEIDIFFYLVSGNQSAKVVKPDRDCEHDNLRACHR